GKFAVLRLFAWRGPQPCPGAGVPLPEQDTVDDGFDEQRLVCVGGSPVGAAITRDEQFGDGPAVAAAYELNLVNAESGPTAVQEQPIILDESKPFVVHIACPMPPADGVPFLIRPASGRRWTPLGQGHGGKARELIPPDYRLLLHPAYRIGRRAGAGKRTSPGHWGAGRSAAPAAIVWRVQESRWPIAIPQKHAGISIDLRESRMVHKSQRVPCLSCGSRRRTHFCAPTNSRLIQQSRLS